MSLDELRADLARNVREAQGILDPATRAHLEQTLWPFLEAFMDQVEEIDDAVAELVNQQEDYLQPATAAVFAAVIQTGLELANELKARAGGDPGIAKKIADHDQLCQAAIGLLGEITMVVGEDDDSEEEGEAHAD